MIGLEAVECIKLWYEVELNVYALGHYIIMDYKMVIMYQSI